MDDYLGKLLRWQQQMKLVNNNVCDVIYNYITSERRLCHGSNHDKGQWYEFYYTNDQCTV